MMWCKKCGGRVLVDRVFTTDNHIEVFCFSCGKRVIFNHPTNIGGFALWLLEKEKKYRWHSSMGQ
jgi:hypothetical protein